MQHGLTRNPSFGECLSITYETKCCGLYQSTRTTRLPVAGYDLSSTICVSVTGAEHNYSMYEYHRTWPLTYSPLARQSAPAVTYHWIASWIPVHSQEGD